MPTWLKFYQSIAAFLGATLGFLYGEWNILLTILIYLVIIDFITGILASALEGSLSSSVGFRGIAKKVVMFAIVGVAHLLDILLISDYHMLRDMTVFFYISNELISITRNAAKSGVPVPAKLKNTLLLLKEKEMNKKDEK